ncbi:MAG: hypothetical protein AAF726_21295 [Planctomycetota bacterium]
MKNTPTLSDLYQILESHPDVSEVRAVDDWEGAICGQFLSIPHGGRLSFLVRPGADCAFCEFVVPGLAKVEVDDAHWTVRAALAQVGLMTTAKIVMTLEGTVHLVLDVPAPAELVVDVVVERALQALRRDSDTLRTALVGLRPEPS